MLDTPVLFLVFNRPDTTRQVFEAIRQARPRQLFIAADGPRPGRPDDAEKCTLVRQVVAQVDWNCEVKTLFRENNLGCKYAVSSAIDWFFEWVEEGIILEDDCLPVHGFFTFCTQMLAYYRDNEQVMHISGSNHHAGKRWGRASYHFSVYNHVWGWATWRRAWRHYDVHMGAWEAFLAENKLGRVLGRKSQVHYWERTFEAVRHNRVDTWDYQWTYALWNANGVSITPHVNLISNIGFGPDATHTTQGSNPFNVAVGILGPLKHPSVVQVDTRADHFLFKRNYDPSPTFANRCRNLAYRVIPASLYQKLKRVKSLIPDGFFSQVG